ncbi:hypothetical protein E4U92_25890 [Streptomyces galbus]|uniref:Uncharacterized protein n=1 Tax=Streptomyces galbus TaxID=33898 RepID=A0A4U5WW17_STRGB|nr:hypothetical protein E4U92_25890 [Streptomyces galbus]
MEICIAVADWARGLTTWVLDVPGGEGTGATRRKRTRHVRHRVHRASPSGSTGWAGWSRCGPGAGMVVGWG